MADSVRCIPGVAGFFQSTFDVGGDFVFVFNEENSHARSIVQEDEVKMKTNYQLIITIAL